MFFFKNFELKPFTTLLVSIFWVGICDSKMSECLRTYGPQIIRVPQLQIED